MISYIIIRIFFTIFPRVYFTFPWGFCNCQFVLLNSFTIFSHPPRPLPSGSCQNVLCIHEFVSILLVHLFCFIFNCTYKINDMVFVFLWLASFSIIPSRSICVVTNGKISLFFYGWVIFHCIYVPHLLYPFTYWWTLRLLPFLGIVNNAVMNIGMHMSFQIRVLHFFR